MRRHQRGLVLSLLVIGACHAAGSDAHDTTVVAAQGSAADSVSASPARPDAVRHAATMAADSIALDSCARLDRDARTQRRVPQAGEAISPPREGSWLATRIAATPRFTIELPAAASPLRLTPDSGFATDSFPGCRYSCIVSVRFRRDSLHEGAGGYVDRLRRDAIASGEDGADWAFGPSRRMHVDGKGAVLVDVPCGDCSSASVYVSRGDTLAEITYSIDDREGYQPGIACRLARVARSFQWP